MADPSPPTSPAASPATSARPAEPLRVAIDVAPLHGHRTGVGLATERLLDELDHRDEVRPVPYLVSFRARPSQDQRRLPLPAAVAMRLWSRTDLVRVDRWLHDVDVVHGTNYVAPSTRLPTVISVYDCWFLANPTATTPAIARAGSVLRRAVSRGARIHVSSHATAEVASALLDTDRISVVHLGPPPPPVPRSDPTASLPLALRDRPFLVSIGTVERRKDLPSLVEAFARLAPGRADLQLALVGAPGDDHDRLLAQVERTPAAVRGRIHLLGGVSAGLRDALLHLATALVYPSIDEGFGFPILEAQQAGTAVVARPAGSIPEVGGDGVALAEDMTVEALAAALEAVVDDDTRRATLVAAGHRNLDRFSWSATATALIDVYRTAIAEHT